MRAPVRLRFLTAWGGYARGAVIEPPAMLRGQLLATRFLGKPIVAVVVDAEPEPKQEPAHAAAGHDRKRKRERHQ